MIWSKIQGWDSAWWWTLFITDYQGWFIDLTALNIAHPTGNAWWYATVGTSSPTMYLWDAVGGVRVDTGYAPTMWPFPWKNIVIVDPDQAPIVGYIYPTYALALAYVQTQSPSMSNIWTIKIAHSLDPVANPDLTLYPYIHLDGDGSGIIPAWVHMYSSWGMAGLLDEYQVTNISIYNLCTDMIFGNNLNIYWGTLPAGSWYIIRNSAVYGGDFSAASSIKLYDNNHTFWGNLGAASVTGWTIHDYFVAYTNIPVILDSLNGFGISNAQLSWASRWFQVLGWGIYSLDECTPNWVNFPVTTQAIAVSCSSQRWAAPIFAMASIGYSRTGGAVKIYANNIHQIYGVISTIRISWFTWVPSAFNGIHSIIGWGWTWVNAYIIIAGSGPDIPYAADATWIVDDYSYRVTWFERTSNVARLYVDTLIWRTFERSVRKILSVPDSSFDWRYMITAMGNDPTPWRWDYIEYANGGIDVLYTADPTLAGKVYEPSRTFTIVDWGKLSVRWCPQIDYETCGTGVINVRWDYFTDNYSLGYTDEWRALNEVAKNMWCNIKYWASMWTWVVLNWVTQNATTWLRDIPTTAEDITWFYVDAWTVKKVLLSWLYNFRTPVLPDGDYYFNADGSISTTPTLVKCWQIRTIAWEQWINLFIENLGSGTATQECNIIEHATMWPFAIGYGQWVQQNASGQRVEATDPQKITGIYLEWWSNHKVLLSGKYPAVNITSADGEYYFDMNSPNIWHLTLTASQIKACTLTTIWGTKYIIAHIDNLGIQWPTPVETNYVYLDGSAETDIFTLPTITWLPIHEYIVVCLNNTFWCRVRTGNILNKFVVNDADYLVNDTEYVFKVPWIVKFIDNWTDWYVDESQLSRAGALVRDDYINSFSKERVPAAANAGTVTWDEDRLAVITTTTYLNEMSHDFWGVRFKAIGTSLPSIWVKFNVINKADLFKTSFGFGFKDSWGAYFWFEYIYGDAVFKFVAHDLSWDKTLTTVETFSDDTVTRVDLICYDSPALNLVAVDSVAGDWATITIDFHTAHSLMDWDTIKLTWRTGGTGTWDWEYDVTVVDANTITISWTGNWTATWGTIAMSSLFCCECFVEGRSMGRLTSNITSNPIEPYVSVLCWDATSTVAGKVNVFLSEVRSKNR